MILPSFRNHLLHLVDPGRTLRILIVNGTPDMMREIYRLYVTND